MNIERLWLVNFTKNDFSFFFTCFLSVMSKIFDNNGETVRNNATWAETIFVLMLPFLLVVVQTHFRLLKRSFFRKKARERLISWNKIKQFTKSQIIIHRNNPNTFSYLFMIIFQGQCFGLHCCFIKTVS